MERARVLLADDHPGCSNASRECWPSEFDIIGTVTDGKALLEAAQSLNPQVVVLDITMPVMDGLEAVRRLKEAGSTAKIVFLTIHQDQDFIRTAIESGAQGYVVKCRLASDLVLAVKEVLAGSHSSHPWNETMLFALTPGVVFRSS